MEDLAGDAMRAAELETVGMLLRASRLLKLSTLTRPRAWRPSPILRSPSKASTSKRITRRSTAITFAVVRTVAPTSDAPRWRISTSVPTVTQPGCRWPRMASPDAISISRIIIGVA